MISIENAEHYKWGDNCDGWHLVKTPTLSVIQEKVPPNASEQRHFHTKAEQFFFVLEGVATITVGDKAHVLMPLQGLHIPAGVCHQLGNSGDVPLVFTVTSTPPSHGDRVLC